MATGGRRTEGYYTIGAVAKMYDIHPQTLRLYEKRGLLHPKRSQGNTRLYSRADLAKLELILTLMNELSVNVAGVEIILQLRERLLKLQEKLEAIREATLGADDLGPGSTKLVLSSRSRLPVRSRRPPPRPKS